MHENTESRLVRILDWLVLSRGQREDGADDGTGKGHTPLRPCIKTR